MQPLLMHSHKELTEILIKYHDIHEGYFALNVEFQVGFGMMGPTPNEAVPSVIAGLARVGLNKVSEPTEHTVDAADVNPAKTVETRAKRTAGKSRAKVASSKTSK